MIVMRMTRLARVSKGVTAVCAANRSLLWEEEPSKRIMQYGPSSPPHGASLSSSITERRKQMEVFVCLHTRPPGPGQSQEWLFPGMGAGAILLSGQASIFE